MKTRNRSISLNPGYNHNVRRRDIATCIWMDIDVILVKLALLDDAADQSWGDADWQRYLFNTFDATIAFLSATAREAAKMLNNAVAFWILL